ncbi:hypothetical protein B0H66DRAFT_549987 [Apodospora peruviana]|uniref:Secreted protein n=1 Tax=Apodospora peruviana TaxID=516989 RepID=A0AAE0IJC4_9PEZI|nr:hypothetical protein B0H66DRAFT_549987 [Apodospora peruviana]
MAFQIKTALVTLVSILAMLMPLVLATPILPASVSVRTAKQLNGLNVVDMDWVGPIFKDNTANTTLSGTAQRIWEQIIAINPNYAAENGIYLNTTAPLTDEIASPADVYSQLDSPNIDCSQGMTTEFDRCWEGILYLRALGQGAGMCNSGPLSCARVSCSWDCGLFLCSLVNEVVWVPCKDIAQDSVTIQHQCNGGSSDNTDHSFTHGRYNFDDHYTEVTLQDC